MLTYPRRGPARITSIHPAGSPSWQSPVLAYDAPSNSVRTETFDGPLELLLYLVRKEGVDIREVRIAPITDAYLAHLEMLEILDLDIAGDFLVLAATLCFLKSRELLPRPPSIEEEENEQDPASLREALARRLIEYQRYQEASINLGNRPWLGRDVFAAPFRPIAPEERPIDPRVGPLGLLEIFQDILTRHAAPEPVHEVHRERYSLKEMAGWVLDQIRPGPRELTDLLGVLEFRMDRVVAFLATLELARMQFLDLEQRYHLGPVILRSMTADPTPDLRALAGEN